MWKALFLTDMKLIGQDLSGDYMFRLETNICGIKFNNPVIAASGTFGYGMEFSRFTNLNKIGGIVVKGISLNPVKSKIFINLRKNPC